MEIAQLVAQYGLGVGLVIYVLIDSARRERRLSDLLQGEVAATKSVLLAHDQRTADAIKGTQESQRYQREEHAKMMEGLTELVTILRRMNGAGIN
jgi:hypothetical protein